MKLDIKNLSESELTEALEKYPHRSFPDLHEEIDAELRNRDIVLKIKSEDPDDLGIEVINNWKKKRKIVHGAPLLLIAIFAIQFFQADRPLYTVMIFAGVVINAYIFEVLKVEYLLKQESIITKIKACVEKTEVDKIIKGPLYLKVVQWSIFTALFYGYYVLEIQSV